MNEPAVSVVLPTYNEVETAPTVVAELRHAVLVGYDHELIVVDDDSPDGTAQAIRDRWGDDDRVRVIQRTDERGLGSAVRRGMDAAENDVVAVLDADGQHPTVIVPRLVRAVEGGADVAVGSRHQGADGGINADWSATRYAMSFGASVLAWAAVPDTRSLQDPMSGCFAVRRDVVAPVLDRLDPDGYKILVEILALAPVATVAEVPMLFDPRAGGESNMDAGEVWGYLRHLARLARESRRVQRPEPVAPREVRK